MKTTHFPRFFEFIRVHSRLFAVQICFQSTLPKLWVQQAGHSSPPPNNFLVSLPRTSFVVEPLSASQHVCAVGSSAGHQSIQSLQSVQSLQTDHRVSDRFTVSVISRAMVRRLFGSRSRLAIHRRGVFHFHRRAEWATGQSSATRASPT